MLSPESYAGIMDFSIGAFFAEQTLFIMAVKIAVFQYDNNKYYFLKISSEFRHYVYNPKGIVLKIPSLCLPTGLITYR